MKKVIADKIQRQREKGNLPVPPKYSMADPQKAKIDFGRLQHELQIASMGQAVIERCIADVREGRVYTFKDITTMLRCSKAKVRLLFGKEPGVVLLGTDYRVPDTVFQRVVNGLIRQRG